MADIGKRLAGQYWSLIPAIDSRANEEVEPTVHGTNKTVFFFQRCDVVLGSGFLPKSRSCFWSIERNQSLDEQN